MTTVPRSALLCPPATPADCRHVREPFDQGFRVINERRDIGPAAKLVYQHLVTLRRLGASRTQAEIGEGVGLSRHQVWRALGELVAAELVTVTRHGQGYPNSYALHGVDEADLDGRASSRRPSRPQVAGPPVSPARARPSTPKEQLKTTRYTPLPVDPAAYTSGRLGAYIRT